jgi:hypothetical protein
LAAFGLAFEGRQVETRINLLAIRRVQLSVDREPEPKAVLICDMSATGHKLSEG